jgi:inhibitor of cysteine peptidase
MTRKNIFNVLMTCMVLGSMILLAGCAKGTTEYSDSGMTIKASPGQAFKIVLDANHTTGYEWQISIPLDTKIVQFDGTDYKAEDTGRVGSGGKEVWTFKAAGKGKTRIFFEYIRPWEEGKKPVDTKTFKVEID